MGRPQALAGGPAPERALVDVTRAKVVRPGDGLRHGPLEFLALTSDTPRLNVGVFTAQPRSGGPEEHDHVDEDDAFFVLEGELTFFLDGAEVVAEAGTFVLVPPGVRHTFANRSDGVTRFLNIHAPAGFDVRIGAAAAAR